MHLYHGIIGVLIFKLYDLLSLPESLTKVRGTLKHLTADTICACSTIQAQNTQCGAILVVGAIPDISVILQALLTPVMLRLATSQPLFPPPPPAPPNSFPMQCHMQKYAKL